MAKFSYKLQNILDIKNKLETQAQSVYAEEIEKLRQEELKLDAIRADIYKYQNAIRGMGESKVNISELKRCSEAIELKKEEAKTQIVRIKRAEKNVEIARQKLSEAMKERKTHEKLREKAFENFLIELEGSEMKEIDELVSFTFNKQE
ncbi:MAG: flagellar export protein FliJ [Lachnospiraceae bacterium]|nr:flagellar export protein FliJ [Lachnospiraceae bacterium]MBQ4069103.1 flagellar export protein FliJ [Lachnospiraceae bacterium]